MWVDCRDWLFASQSYHFVRFRSWKRLHIPNKSLNSSSGTLQLQLAYFPIRDTTGERVEPAATKGSALGASATAAVPEEGAKVDPKEEANEEGPLAADKPSDSAKHVVGTEVPPALDLAPDSQLKEVSAELESLKAHLLANNPVIRG